MVSQAEQGHILPGPDQGRASMSHALKFLFALDAVIAWFVGNFVFWASRSRDGEYVAFATTASTIALVFIAVVGYAIWMATK